MTKFLPCFLLILWSWPIGLGAQEEREVLLSLGYSPDQYVAFYLPTDTPSPDSAVILLAFHPFHSSRWNGRTWEKALQPLAEQQQCILICPDGGADHRSDGYMDLVAAKRALDSVIHLTGIQSPQVITIGFGHGAKAALNFALNYPTLVKGAVLWATPAEHIPEIHEAHPQAARQMFYLINGSRDALSNRFFPLRQALIRLGATCGYQILEQSGHNLRQLNEVFGQGVRWVMKQPVRPAGIKVHSVRHPRFQLYPNPARPGQPLQIQFLDGPGPILEMRVFDTAGLLKQVVYRPERQYWIAPTLPGNYVISAYTADEVFSYRLWIQAR